MRKFIKRFAGPYKKSIAFILILIMFQAATQLLLPFIMAVIVDEGIANNNIPKIVQMGSVMLIVAGLGVGLAIYANYYISKVTQSVARDARKDMFYTIARLSRQQFEAFGESTLTTRTTNDVMQVMQFINTLLRVVVMAPIMFIGAMILSIWMNPTLSVAIFVPLPLIILSVWFIAKKATPLFHNVRDQLDKIHLVLRETLAGMKVIKLYRKKEHEKQRFKETNYNYFEFSLTVNRLMNFLTPTIMLILNFSILGIIWLGSSLISSGNLQVGQLMAFIQYAIQIMFSVVMASVALAALPRATVSAKRMMEVLEELPVSDLSINKNIRQHVKTKPLQFNDVSFYYPGSERPALSHVSMTIQPNKVNAIVGGTGSGKSTLLKILLQFYKPSFGSITVGPGPLHDFAPSNWRDAVGYVPQKNHLFTGSVEQNIRLGNVSATNEELSKALDDANLRTIIERLPNKLQTILNSKATNMSGGQRQRVSIARAFITDAPIYVFDDSFSALDFQTIAQLKDTFQKKAKDSTCIISSQDIHTVKYADHITILEKGEVVATGSYEELTANPKLQVKGE
ncbi:ABC transporter ATP-binding protein [Oceanobacillus picturae]|uniref:ABC transporter ATP-binding protein n=1 Tax=Oceanobacillus picturae TaxID=171693 RepID=UPI00362D2869